MTPDHECNVAAIPEFDENDAHAPIMALLSALGIVEVTYSLDGSGDSGECTLDQVLYADGRNDVRLPLIPIGFSGDGNILLLDSMLEHIVADLPEGDWVNNEGGYGAVIVNPAATDPDERFVCDMTYREEGDYGEDDDEEDFDDLDPPQEEEPDEDRAVSVGFDVSPEGTIP